MSYKRVNKPTARRMFNKGYNIKLIPCKVSYVAIYTEGNEWFTPITICITDSKEDSNKFDRAVNEYEYYNCNAELGYYAHYYVSEEDYAKYEEEQKSVARKH